MPSLATCCSRTPSKSDSGSLYSEAVVFFNDELTENGGITFSAVMNAAAWKGQVLFTDFNSGRWAAKLEPKPKVTT